MYYIVAYYDIVQYNIIYYAILYDTFQGPGADAALEPLRVEQLPKSLSPLGIHYRGVQWEGGAVDWGSII